MKTTLLCDILGDLNADMMASSKLPKRDKQELLNFSRAYNFTQLIKEPTRITDTSRTMIDLVFANNEHRIVKSGITTKAKPRILEYRSYKNFDPTLFNDDLRNIPWYIVENEDNVNDAFFTWNKMFSEVADQHAPVKRRRVKGTTLPWMNSQISDSMKERDWAHRKARKSNSARHWSMYAKLRNKVNGLVRTSKSKYYCDMIEEAKGDSDKVWKTVNKACNRNSSSESIQCIISDGVQHITSQSIASSMNSFFASIGRILASRIQTPVLNLKSISKHPLFQFELTELDQSFVLEQLLSLKANKAIGLDKISARLLKISAHTIAPSVVKLLNLSICTSQFPKLWKCAKFAALFKSGDRTNVSNYRPSQSSLH